MGHLGHLDQQHKTDKKINRTIVKSYCNVKKSHHMPVKIPKSVHVTVSAALSTAIDHALDSNSNSDREELLSCALFVLGTTVSTRTEQVPRESLSSLLRKNVRSFNDVNFDVFSTAFPEFSKPHPRTSPTRTYQCHLRASPTRTYQCHLRTSPTRTYQCHLRASVMGKLIESDN